MTMSFGFLRTLVGSSPICRSRASTAEASPASISPDLTSPCLVFADHFQTGTCFTAGAGAAFVFTFAAAAWAMSSSRGAGRS